MFPSSKLLIPAVSKNLHGNGKNDHNKMQQQQIQQDDEQEMENKQQQNQYNNNSNNHKNNNNKQLRKKKIRSLLTEQQVNRILNRPTRSAAYEFFMDHHPSVVGSTTSTSTNSSTNNTNSSCSTHIDWKELPARLSTLCSAINQWEKKYDNDDNEDQDDDLSLLFYDSSNYENQQDALKAARIAAMTASVMYLAPCSFPKSFESLLLASLDYRDSYHDQHFNDDDNEVTMNEDDGDNHSHDMIGTSSCHQYLEALTLQNRNDDDDDDNNNHNHMGDTSNSHQTNTNTILQQQQQRYNEWEQTLFTNIRRTGWIIRTSTTTADKKQSSSRVGGSCGGLLYRQLENAILETATRKIKKVIEKDDNEYHPNLYRNQIQPWKEQVIETWLLDLLYGGNHDDDTTIQHEDDRPSSTLYEVDPRWYEQLDYTITDLYMSLRMEQIFSIVTDYPDSHGTVLELKQLLEKQQYRDYQTQQHFWELGNQLRKSLIHRLNHPGANTSQIIDVYIATIKVLRIIDSSDRLLSMVAEPVRTYLRGRKDTIRCIISSLTDVETGGELYQELRRQDAKPLENIMIDSDDEEEPPDLYHWQPLPSIYKTQNMFVKPLHDNNGGRNQNQENHNQQPTAGGGDCDILAMLVSIYGSKELFVDEYRLMLADKLLANLEYNTDHEVHTLELLKLRFGESSMRNCEVMIKDMDDSKRTNALIHSSLESTTATAATTSNKSSSPVDVVMVSHIFWPTLQNKEPLKHHPRIQGQLDEFSEMYAKLKNPRKLEWMDQLGSVQLELEVLEEGEEENGDSMDGASVPPHVEIKEITCSPLLATLITHFEDQPVWTSEELSNETGVPEHIIQKRMSFWISNRVVVVVANTTTTIPRTYELASFAVGRQSQQQQSYQQQQPGNNMMILDDDQDHDTKAVSASTQEQEEMDVYESFISAMLTNTGQSSLERIHNMLKMFVSAGSETKYNKTIQQLHLFLQHLCRQEKLECGPDGMYKLMKKENII